MKLWSNLNCLISNNENLYDRDGSGAGFVVSNGDITLTFDKKVLQFLCHQKYSLFQIAS